MKVNRKAITWYLVLAFLPAWILFTIPLAFGEVGTPARQTASLVCFSAAMWAPGVSALVCRRWVEKQPVSSLNLRRLGPKRAYLWAWLVPIFLTVISGLLTWAFGVGRFDSQLPFIRQAMQQAPSVAGAPPALVIGLQSLVGLSVGALFNTLFTLGEELGWRGYLLPGLLGLGQGRAILFSGAVWGIWHAPAIFQGRNYPGYPLPGAFMMVVFCVLMGSFLSWLYLWTRSPWTPALGHGSLNAIAGLPLLFLADVNMLLGGTLASLIGWIPLLAFVGWLVWRKKLPVTLEDVSRETSQPGTGELAALPE